ncbi:MAG TPA: MmcQ/YjbR family DNA-binding protein [Bacteroidia bacterium]|nr:MmcQ/YjbR family DNA-binding protein [Bacteroidia bacterium]
MNIELIRNYCMNKKGVTESFPFDSDTLVFKVMGKMFLLTSLSEPEKINVKCDPETAIDLREKYDAVQPGYHMNKKHWNTIDMAQGLTDVLIKKWIDDSYDLIVNDLPKKVKLEYEGLK